MKDPAEYNAYMGAEQQTDDAAKISGFEAFLKQFPNSSYKEDALELLMIAYQKTNNQPKMLETADKILQVNPCNLRALALIAYSKQAAATGPSAQQSLSEAGHVGGRLGQAEKHDQRDLQQRGRHGRIHGQGLCEGRKVS
jgi:tetratricopeptide (TPR) repeat protein